MNNRSLVIPRYRLVKMCHDEKGRVTWEKRWFFNVDDLMSALDMFLRAADYWLPDSENGTVILFEDDLVLCATGFGIEVGACGIGPCGSDCSICPIGSGM